MTLVLHVDGERWRDHLRQMAEAHPGLVPVAKGNGYGFGIGRLARRTAWLAGLGLGCDTLAVGTYAEIEHVASRFDGDVVVLAPWRPWDGGGPEHTPPRRGGGRNGRTSVGVRALGHAGRSSLVKGWVAVLFARRTHVLPCVPGRGAEPRI